ncbi:hypothetical protein [Streptomyces sp. NPDC053367]|uniref:hypothetical protein n=1 Tax=Streptomyces sp. NPDC053367 TaxID=3365700 RepID=UPI0037D131DB
MLTEDNLPAGAHGELVQALRQLHDEAGKPSLRKVADQITKRHGIELGVSYETVRKMLNGIGTVPKWEKWQVVVGHLCLAARHDDPDTAERRFLELWRKAKAVVDAAPVTDRAPPPDSVAARNAAAEEMVAAMYAAAHADAERIRAAARSEAAAVKADGGPRRAPAGKWRQPLGVLGVHGLFGLLLGLVVGLLVNSAVLPLTESPFHGAVGAIVGLAVGMFTGTVIASMGGADVGRIFLIRDALAGLAGCGGLLGLALGVGAGIQHGGAVGVALWTAAGGSLLGCLIGAMVYGVRLLHAGARTTAQGEAMERWGSRDRTGDHRA